MFLWHIWGLEQTQSNNRERERKRERRSPFPWPSIVDLGCVSLVSLQGTHKYFPSQWSSRFLTSPRNCWVISATSWRDLMPPYWTTSASRSVKPCWSLRRRPENSVWLGGWHGLSWSFHISKTGVIILRIIFSYFLRDCEKDTVNCTFWIILGFLGHLPFVGQTSSWCWAAIPVFCGICCPVQQRCLKGQVTYNIYI